MSVVSAHVQLVVQIIFTTSSNTVGALSILPDPVRGIHLNSG